MFTVTKWSCLQEKVTKFTPKSFEGLAPGGVSENNLTQKDVTCYLKVRYTAIYIYSHAAAFSNTDIQSCTAMQPCTAIQPSTAYSHVQPYNHLVIYIHTAMYSHSAIQP
jgi:hypothetical protein